MCTCPGVVEIPCLGGNNTGSHKDVLLQTQTFKNLWYILHSTRTLVNGTITTHWYKPLVSANICLNVSLFCMIYFERTAWKGKYWCIYPNTTSPPRISLSWTSSPFFHNVIQRLNFHVFYIHCMLSETFQAFFCVWT